VIALVAGLGLAAANPATARAGSSFPRVGVLWPDVTTYSDSSIARYDFVVLADSTASHLSSIKATNPDITALRGVSACELDFYPTRPATDLQNLYFAKASARWLLTQAGSTLSGNVTAATTSFPVAATTASGKALFAVGDFVVIEEEIAKVTAVGTNTITVARGQVHPAASHSAGTRIAAAIQFWPNSLVFDVTAACPRVTVDGAVGPENWNEWNARQIAASIANPAWSGVFLDRSEANQSWLVTSGYARTIDPDRSNTVLTDYTNFNTTWNSGLVVLEARLRTLLGDRIIQGNTAYPNYDKLNGTLFEHFPNDAGGWYNSSWHATVVGPSFSKGSYLTDWMTKCPQPSLSTIWTKECELTPNQAAGIEPFDNPFLKPGFAPNYRKMRFGLTTTLLGDGIFAYGPGTSETAGKGLMWFDEYDNAGAGKGYLGSPLGPMYSVAPALVAPDLLHGNGGFGDQAVLGTWTLYRRPNYAATSLLDSGLARIQITQSAGELSGVLLEQHDVGVVAGATYTLSFRARADRPLSVQALVQQAGSPYSVRMTTRETELSTDWRTFEIPLTSSGTDPAAELLFSMGGEVGTIWLGDVKLQAGDRNVYRRDYEGGVVLVNATGAAATSSLDGVFRKIRGTQDSLLNDGALATAVTIPARDGLVLLRTTEPPGNAPVANADFYDTANSTTLKVPTPGLLGNDTDAGGEALATSAVTQPAHGTLSLSSDGSFVYTPTAGFAGVDFFTYRVYDGAAYSPAATVCISVANPVAVEPVVAGPITITPTIVSKPIVKRVRTRGTRRTYSVSGSVRLGSVTRAASADSVSTAGATPVVLTVQIERYAKKRWRVYKKLRVVKPGSRYSIRAKLRSGKYRARTLVSGGSVPAAKSAATRSFTVR
jgi:hypothetical protein